MAKGLLKTFTLMMSPASLVPRPSSHAVDPLPQKLSERKAYHVTNVVNLPQVGVLDFAPTHSKHANMTYQQLLHLHCIQSGLLAKAKELSLAQGVNLLHSSQDHLQASNNVSCGGCGSVIAHAQLSCFYLPSTLT